MKLSIIIPTYNNCKSLHTLIFSLKKLSMKGITKEIIVVNDCSPDNTISVLKKIKGIIIINHTINTGKGGAIKSGLNKATGDIFYIQDDDLEYSTDDIPKIIQPIIRHKTDVVYGSRRLLSTNKYSSWLFYAGGVLTDNIVSLIVRTKLTDSITGAKAFSRKAYLTIKPIETKGFEIEAELTAKFIKHGFIPIEIPIHYNPRSIKEGKNIRWHHLFPIVITAWKYTYY
jgi:dolichol-phosphate mannosyltransferase